MLAACLATTLVAPSEALWLPAADPGLFPSAPAVAFRLHRPESPFVALTLDKPWEGPESGYATVLEAPDGYRLYYRAGGERTREFTCVALSDDGVRWSRWSGPARGLEASAPVGSNVVWTADRPSYGESHNLFPFLDSNPRCRPDARFKAVGFWIDRTDGEERTLCTLVSQDGFRWRRVSNRGAIRGGRFDSLNTAFFDPALGRYVCYFRDSRDGVRWVKRATSADFSSWSAGDWVAFPSLSGQHLYTNGIQPYPGAPGLYVAMPMRFVPSRRAIGDPPRDVDGVSDGLLLFGRGGLRFETHFGQAWIAGGTDPLNWGNAHGNNTPVVGWIRRPDRWLAYWMDHYGATPRIMGGSVRPHGFASLAAGIEAKFLTRALTEDAGELRLNYATSAAGEVRVAVADASARPYPGFGFDDCPELFGDELSRAVRWRGGGLGSAPRPRRLLFRLREAELFAIGLERGRP
ncbi:MAG: hypothetical protein ACK41F_00170 [Fimbriimonadaceae bacterium]